MAKQTPKTSLLNKVHACDQCLQSFAESNPGKEPLVPGPSAASSAKACCQCGFLLTSSFLLGLCRICERGFCDASAALTRSDLDVKGREWNGLVVTRFDCMVCAGRDSYAQGRRSLFCRLIKDLSDGTGKVSDPLRMKFEKIHQSIKCPDGQCRCRGADAGQWART